MRTLPCRLETRYHLAEPPNPVLDTLNVSISVSTTDLSFDRVHQRLRDERIIYDVKTLTGDREIKLRVDEAGNVIQEEFEIRSPADGGNWTNSTTSSNHEAQVSYPSYP